MAVLGALSCRAAVFQHRLYGLHLVSSRCSCSLSDFLLKVALVGSEELGKSALVRCFADGFFSESYAFTNGVDFVRFAIARRMIAEDCLPGRINELEANESDTAVGDS